MPELLKSVLALTFPAFLILAAVRDATTFTIPNWITLGLAASFAPVALAFGLPIGEAGVHLAVGAVALVAGMVLFYLGWLGGGDAKLLAAAALWLGWPASIEFVAVTTLAGGVLACALMALRSGRVRPLVAVGPAWFQRLAEKGESAPYGVAIAVGGLYAFPHSMFVGG